MKTLNSNTQIQKKHCVLGELWENQSKAKMLNWMPWLWALGPNSRPGLCTPRSRPRANHWTPKPRSTFCCSLHLACCRFEWELPTITHCMPSDSSCFVLSKPWKCEVVSQLCVCTMQSLERQSEKLFLPTSPWAPAWVSNLSVLCQVMVSERWIWRTSQSFRIKMNTWPAVEKNRVIPWRSFEGLMHC